EPSRYSCYSPVLDVSADRVSAFGKDVLKRAQRGADGVGYATWCQSGRSVRFTYMRDGTSIDGRPHCSSRQGRITITPIDFIRDEREQVIDCLGVLCFLIGIALSPQGFDVVVQKCANVARSGSAGTERTLRMAHPFPEYPAWHLKRDLGNAALAAKLERSHRVDNKEIAGLQRDFVSLLTI